MARIVGANPGDHIARGQFYRVTLGLNFFGTLALDAIGGEQTLFQRAFDAIARTRLVFPVHNLERTPGMQTTVIDTVVNPSAPSVSVAYLARELTDLVAGVDLMVLEKVTIDDVNDRGGRTAAQQLAEGEHDASSFWKRFGDQAKYVKWIFILLGIAALLLAASRAISAAKS